VPRAQVAAQADAVRELWRAVVEVRATPAGT
jgi:hypothetical protein